MCCTAASTCNGECSIPHDCHTDLNDSLARLWRVKVLAKGNEIKRWPGSCRIRLNRYFNNLCSICSYCLSVAPQQIESQRMLGSHSINQPVMIKHRVGREFSFTGKSSWRWKGLSCLQRIPLWTTKFTFERQGWTFPTLLRRHHRKEY